MNKTIGITYDIKPDWVIKEGDPKDINAEFDPPEVLEALIRAIESLGYTVKRLGNAKAFIKQVETLDVDIVFNICEGYTGRNRESEVPLVCEMYDIPFIGSDALTLGLTLDKVLAKKCFIAENIPTPKFFQARSTEDLKNLTDLSYPLIVKCRNEGTSKGISFDSRVTNYEDLTRKVELINTTYDQPAIIEEFIKGTEFTIAVIGNENPEPQPPVQVSIDGNTELGDQFYTFEMVSSPALQYVCPAKISKELETQMQELAVRVYKCVDCLDVGRVDFRVDENGNPYVLEINPLPSYALEDVFNIFPQVSGSTFEKTIGRIIESGLKRYNLLETTEELTATKG